MKGVGYLQGALFLMLLGSSRAALLHAAPTDETLMADLTF